MTAAARAKKPTWRDILRALRRRKTLAMLVLGFAAGLPYVLITGTLNAWFTNDHIDVKTIGVFSWIIIIYGFKFLWSPAIDRAPAPPLFGMGQRRAGIFILQTVIVAALGVISTVSPHEAIGVIAVAAVVCTFASASQDILIDAWRIEVADEDTPVDLLSSVYQVGYRLAAILGGAGALIMAARVGWNTTFVALAALMTLGIVGVFIALDGPPRRRAIEVDAAAPAARLRNLAVAPVMILWATSFTAIFSFMAYALEHPDKANAGAFTRETGPLIVLGSIIAPVMIAAWLLRLNGKARRAEDDRAWPAQKAFDAVYASVMEPLVDILKRLGAGAVLVLALILSYRFADLVWGAFAFPFYLGDQHGALHHTNDEVAIASKVFGALMTFFGITIGAAAIIRFGRMPCLFLGAVLAAATNLLFADLALGGAGIDAFMRTFGLYGIFPALQPLADSLTLQVSIDERLSRLMVVIGAENLAVGFASAAIVAYLSSIVNPRFAAVQYALFASLTMLIGSLGRGALGELIEARGFAYVFFLTAALGLVAVAASGLEWFRQSRAGARSHVALPDAPSPPLYKEETPASDSARA
jgi:MFS transporter, PAT family, beta-lactamase induction signal transducer AmpG